MISRVYRKSVCYLSMYVPSPCTCFNIKPFGSFAQFYASNVFARFRDLVRRGSRYFRTLYNLLAWLLVRVVVPF